MKQNFKNQKRLLCTTQYKSDRKPRWIALFSRKIQNKTPKTKNTHGQTEQYREPRNKATHILSIFGKGAKNTQWGRESLQ